MLRITKIILSIIGLLFFVGVMNYLYGTPSKCGDSSEAVQKAKGLSQERLEKIYYAVKSMAPKNGSYHRVIIYPNDNKNPMPKELLDLNPLYIVFFATDRAEIYLERCTHDTVVTIPMYWPKDGVSTISLRWNEISREQLWSK